MAKLAHLSHTEAVVALFPVRLVLLLAPWVVCGVVCGAGCEVQGPILDRADAPSFDAPPEHDGFAHDAPDVDVPDDVLDLDARYDAPDVDAPYDAGPDAPFDAR